MSPTVNTGSCWAKQAVASNSQPAALRHTNRLDNGIPWKEIVLAMRGEYAGQVVEQRDAHQQHEQQQARPLAHHAGTLGQRAALGPLRDLEHDLAAVENRDRQQVEEAE